MDDPKIFIYRIKTITNSYDIISKQGYTCKQELISFMTSPAFRGAVASSRDLGVPKLDLSIFYLPSESNFLESS